MRNNSVTSIYGLAKRCERGWTDEFSPCSRAHGILEPATSPCFSRSPLSPLARSERYPGAAESYLDWCADISSIEGVIESCLMIDHAEQGVREPSIASVRHVTCVDRQLPRELLLGERTTSLTSSRT